MRRMILTLVGATILAAPTSLLMAAPTAMLIAAPTADHGKIVLVHTGRGKSAVRTGNVRQYRSYSVQPAPRTYRAPAQPGSGQVIRSQPIQSTPQVIQSAPIRGQ
jgi:hypothetical protein